MSLARPRPFKQVDVFTGTPYFGNPVAVVLDGQGLADAAMQRFAAWTNLSETTFVLPASDARADYRVRIFTPGGELPFAGHPTLGTCHAWLEAGGRPRASGRIVQQCALGLVDLRRDAGRLSFAAPALGRSAPSPTLLARAASALGLEARQIEAAQLLDNGPVWLGLLLRDPATVLALQPDHQAIRSLGQNIGVCALEGPPAASLLVAPANREARAFATGAGTGAAAAGPAAPALEVRAFAAPIGVPEDPVTGSLNASLAQWLIAEGRLPGSYVAGQGQRLGRNGRVHIQRDGAGQVWVGGDCVTCIAGQVPL